MGAKNENAPAGTEAGKPKHYTANLAENFDLRKELKRALFPKKTAADVAGDRVAMSADTPANNDANDLMQEAGVRALADLLVLPVALPAVAPSPAAPPSVALPAVAPSPVAPAMRYKLLTDGDLCKLPPIQWRIKNVLPSEGTAVVFGPSGSGKSFLVLDMLQSLAAGTKWFGQKVKQCSVTYIVLEGEAGLAGRVDAYRIWHGSTSSNIRYMVQPFRLLHAEDINELVQAIQAAGTGDVVVLDTLSRATPGTDENDSKSMSQIIATAKILQDLIGGLVLLVHHTGKDASKGLRGHSSLHAALDCAIEVKRDGDLRSWRIAKSKDGEDGASYPFKLKVVPLGHDNEGDKITSCVIVPDQSTQAIQKKIPTLGSNQDIAHKALEKLLSKSVDIDKDGAPERRPCISFDAALAIVTPLIPAEAKHQKQRAKEAIAGLVRKGVMGMKGDWLWAN